MIENMSDFYPVKRVKLSQFFTATPQLKMTLFSARKLRICCESNMPRHNIKGHFKLCEEWRVDKVRKHLSTQNLLITIQTNVQKKKGP